jgi:hypothetical protein
MFVTLPAEDETPLPNDPATLQRQVRALQQEVRARAAAPTKIVEVPVWTDEQFACLQGALKPVLDILQEMAAAHPLPIAAPALPVAPAAAPPLQVAMVHTPPHAPSSMQSTPAPRRKRHAPTNDIDQILAIQAIAAKVEQARKVVMQKDASAHRYLRRVLHTLWSKALRPDDIAEGRGTGTRTVARLRVVCRALVEVKLLMGQNNGSFTVNQPEIDRLRKLDQALHGHI